MKEPEVKIVHCIPIGRGINKECLSYFTTLKVEPGAIVKVPLRGKSIAAIVESVQSASAAKSAIRSQSFKTRKVEKILKKSFFSPHLLAAAKRSADYHASSTGAILSNIIPKTILDNIEDIKMPLRNEASFMQEKLALQGSKEDRIAHYKSIVREAFARSQSVFICVPTIEEGCEITKRLERGIENFTYFLHGDITPKEMVKQWNAILKEKHPVLIVATSTHLSIPRRDLGVYILDHESSRNFASDRRPFLDIRRFVENIVDLAGAQIIFADLLLTVETINRQREGEFGEAAPLTFRSLSQAEHAVIDIREEESSISVELKLHVEEAINQKENVVIYNARKGLAPLTICSDCGSIVRCKECDATIALHAKKTGNRFVCHHCGHHQETKVTCTNCTSWKLTPLGAGVEQVEKDLREMFPDTPVFRLDTETTPTDRKAVDARNEFYATEGAIMVGTSRALTYLHEPVPVAAVVGIDSLFMVPDYRIHGQIMHTLLTVRSLAEEYFIIQTREPENKLWSLALSGNLMDFHREEIREREEFDYPPFSTLIKISRTGTPAAASKDMKKLEELLKRHTYDTYESPYATRSQVTLNTLVKHSKWIDDELLARLRSLPPSYTIEVNPRNIF